MDFKGKELIIFDFDGTLINSIPDLTIAINRMLLHYNLRPLTVHQVAPFVGNGVKPLVKRSLECSFPDRELSNEFLEEAVAVYFSAYHGNPCQETYLYPGVLETLQYLHQKEYKMVICTNKPYRFIEPILDKLSIKSFFTYWIGEDSLAEKKPNASPLLHLAKVTDTKVENCIMVGDSKNDILAAKNAGMQNIGVSYGYNYNEQISDYEPSLVVNHFLELKDLF